MSDDHMTTIDGVRVRKDEEARFRAVHKSVPGPVTSAKASGAKSTKKATSTRKGGSNDDSGDAA